MKSPHRARELRLQDLTESGPLDVLVVGGGMTGAPLYHELCARGYRVALIDKGDFSSGTSQASGMLIWGGLLYLKNLDFRTVLQLCKARRELLRMFPNEISVVEMQYLAARARLGPALVWLVLQLYWLLGGCALRRPAALAGEEASFVYQEAMLRQSDSRFVIDWIRAFDSEHCLPLNYCRLVAAEFDPQVGLWRVVLRDEVGGTQHEVKTRTLVNAAGIWTDGLNALLGLDSPFKHVFSKGVYLAFPRDGRQCAARIYPMGNQDDVLTQVPWGPVVMWGPTETGVRDPEAALAPDRDDLRFLLSHANQVLAAKVGAEDVVSIRCGVRALAVGRNYSKDVYPLELSRRHRVVVHRENRALSLYGGKITSSVLVARQAAGLLGSWVSPRHGRRAPSMEVPEMACHPGLRHDFVTAKWARDREFCLTLEDYLRRRTTIAQWTPRMGLERDGSGRIGLLQLAATFAHDPRKARAVVNAYEQQVRSTYDPLLAV
jgi:glycerol-3-phosphate dehydrogenase